MHGSDSITYLRRMWIVYLQPGPIWRVALLTPINPCTAGQSLSWDRGECYFNLDGAEDDQKDRPPGNNLL